MEAVGPEVYGEAEQRERWVDFIFSFGGFIVKDLAHHFDPPDGVAPGLVHEALVAAVAAHGVRFPLEATPSFFLFCVARDATQVGVHPPPRSPTRRRTTTRWRRRVRRTKTRTNRTHCCATWTTCWTKVCTCGNMSGTSSTSTGASSSGWTTRRSCATSSTRRPSSSSLAATPATSRYDAISTMADSSSPIAAFDTTTVRRTRTMCGSSSRERT